MTPHLNDPGPDPQRLAREAKFHDRRYDENTRAPTDKFYAITRTSFAWYRQRVMADVAGRRVLEYGCGPGMIAFDASAAGADAFGIDISPVAIEHARARAAGLTNAPSFSVDNAEHTRFPDASFDRIAGSGILHHLALEPAYGELARLLRPGGSAVFLEPLGHNFLINAYRRRTPEQRTPDEHPLLRADVRACAQRFLRMRARFFHASVLAAVPLKGTVAFGPVLSVLEAVDRIILCGHSPMRWQAWMLVIECIR